MEWNDWNVYKKKERGRYRWIETEIYTICICIYIDMEILKWWLGDPKSYPKLVIYMVELVARFGISTHTIDVGHIYLYVSIDINIEY